MLEDRTCLSLNIICILIIYLVGPPTPTYYMTYTCKWGCLAENVFFHKRDMHIIDRIAAHIYF